MFKILMVTLTLSFVTLSLAMAENQKMSSKNMEKMNSENMKNSKNIEEMEIKRFKEIDSNNNGSISFEEFKVFSQKQRQNVVKKQQGMKKSESYKNMK